MNIRNRIRELRTVRAGDLCPNPRNWRTHPKSQQDALRGVLAEIGYADALITRELPDGSLEILDGHLRAETTPDTEVPVLVTDLDEHEAVKLLATLDPLSAMADADPVALEALLREVQTSSEAVAEMLEGLAEGAGILAGDDEGNGDDTYTNKIEAPIYQPKGERPLIVDLIDRRKTQELLLQIEAAELPEELAGFLRLAAERHTVFKFREIAEFYCHATPEVQDLMERSGLVIIDFRKAIEYGFVNLTKRLGQLADIEESDGDS